MAQTRKNGDHPVFPAASQPTSFPTVPSSTTPFRPNFVITGVGTGTYHPDYSRPAVYTGPTEEEDEEYPWLSFSDNELKKIFDARRAAVDAPTPFFIIKPWPTPDNERPMTTYYFKNMEAFENYVAYLREYNILDKGTIDRKIKKIRTSNVARMKGEILLGSKNPEGVWETYWRTSFGEGWSTEDAFFNPGRDRGTHEFLQPTLQTPIDPSNHYQEPVPRTNGNDRWRSQALYQGDGVEGQQTAVYETPEPALQPEDDRSYARTTGVSSNFNPLGNWEDDPTPADSNNGNPSYDYQPNYSSHQTLHFQQPQYGDRDVGSNEPTTPYSPSTDSSWNETLEDNPNDDPRTKRLKQAISCVNLMMAGLAASGAGCGIASAFHPHLLPIAIGLLAGAVAMAGVRYALTHSSCALFSGSQKRRSHNTSNRYAALPQDLGEGGRQSPSLYGRV